MLRPGAQSLQTARAAAALPAAGAYDAAPTELSCQAAGAVTLFTTYTRAGVGGSVRLRVQVSPYAADIVGVQNWFQLSLYAAAVLAAGADANSFVQRETILYTSTAAGAETFAYGPIRLDGTISRLRIAAAEVGAQGTPGACEIVALFQQGLS